MNIKIKVVLVIINVLYLLFVIGLSVFALLWGISIFGYLILGALLMYILFQNSLQSKKGLYLIIASFGMIGIFFFVIYPPRNIDMLMFVVMLVPPLLNIVYSVYLMKENGV